MRAALLGMCLVGMTACSTVEGWLGMDDDETTVTTTTDKISSRPGTPSSMTRNANRIDASPRGPNQPRKA